MKLKEILQIAILSLMGFGTVASYILFEIYDDDNDGGEMLWYSFIITGLNFSIYIGCMSYGNFWKQDYPKLRVSFMFGTGIMGSGLNVMFALIYKNSVEEYNRYFWFLIVQAGFCLLSLFIALEEIFDKTDKLSEYQNHFSLI